METNTSVIHQIKETVIINHERIAQLELTEEVRKDLVSHSNLVALIIMELSKDVGE